MAETQTPARRPRWPAARVPRVLTPRFWGAKRLALLIGFLLTLAGSFGTDLVVTPVATLSDTLDLQAKDLQARIDTLRDAESQYLLFQQQGALIFALTAAGVTTNAPNGQALVGKLYALDMIDRAGAIRTLVGNVAMAGVLLRAPGEAPLDYPSTMARYDALVAEARKGPSLDSYTAVDSMETTLVAGASAWIGRLQGVLQGTLAAKAQADGQADRRRLWLTVLMALGSAFLLAANLIATREAPVAEAPGEGTAGEGTAGAGLPGPRPSSPDDRVTELSTAAYLIEVALDRARSMGGAAERPRGGPPGPEGREATS